MSGKDLAFSRTTKLSDLLHPVRLRQLAADWLLEDVPAFDYGGFVVGETTQTALLLCKSPGVLAGVPFFDAVFSQLDCTVTWNAKDGDFLQPVCQVATVVGKARHILLGERVALNCLTRASGIATDARRLRQVADTHGWHGDIAGTRKTTPGFRLVEKYSLLVGGLATHRHDLSAMVMIKDNHIWSAGNITQAVRDARKVCGFSQKIEVECRSITDAYQAADAGADVIMFDNFQPQALHEAARQLKTRYPNVLVEASGGVTADGVTQFFSPDVDVVSLGSVTLAHGIVDFSLKIRSPGHDPANPTVTADTPH